MWVEQRDKARKRQGTTPAVAWGLGRCEDLTFTLRERGALLGFESRETDLTEVLTKMHPIGCWGENRLQRVGEKQGD